MHNNEQCLEGGTHLIVRQPLRLKEQHSLAHMAVVVSEETLQSLVSCVAEYTVTVTIEPQRKRRKIIDVCMT